MSFNACFLMGFITTILMIASTIIASVHFIRKTAETSKLMDIIKSWWIIIALIFTTLAGGALPFLVFIATVSFFALREFVSVIPISPNEKRLYALFYLLVPLYFLGIVTQEVNETLAIAPIVMFYLASTVFLMAGNMAGYFRSVSACAMAFFVTVYSLSHISLLLYLPESDASVVLFLLFLVQFNDVAQWFWGRFWGKRKIAPRISPNKTVEGLVGGVTTTTLLCALIAPYLLQTNTLQAFAIGVSLSILGFLGDLTLSAIKRGANVKDFSNLIPGHGGILDRVDSLVFSAPAFYYLMRYA